MNSQTEELVFMRNPSHSRCAHWQRQSLLALESERREETISIIFLLISFHSFSSFNKIIPSQFKESSATRNSCFKYLTISRASSSFPRLKRDSVHRQCSSKLVLERAESQDAPTALSWTTTRRALSMIMKLFMIIFMLLPFSKFCRANKPFSALMFKAHIMASYNRN